MRIVLLVLVVCLCGLAERRRRLRAERAAEADGLVRVIDDVARSLRAHHSLHDALAAAQRTAPPALRAELAVVTDACASGRSLAGELASWQHRADGPDAQLAIAALRLTLGAGADAGRALEGVASTLRERMELAREVHALTAQARLSSGVLVAAPLAFAAVSGIVDPATASFLVESPGGIACLAGGIGLDALGFAWMARAASGVAR